MKKLGILVGIILSATFSYAGQDRFGSMRKEVLRSSFTNSVDPGVNIASNTVPGWDVLKGSSTGYLGFILRYVNCSGVNPSTITFFDTIIFNSVVFPIPFFPIKPICSPASIPNERESKRVPLT